MTGESLADILLCAYVFVSILLTDIVSVRWPQTIFLLNFDH